RLPCHRQDKDLWLSREFDSSRANECAFVVSGDGDLVGHPAGAHLNADRSEGGGHATILRHLDDTNAGSRRIAKAPAHKHRGIVLDRRIYPETRTRSNPQPRGYIEEMIPVQIRSVRIVVRHECRSFY